MLLKLLNARKVQISRLGVQLFNAQWPCSPLSPDRCYWFEFDADGDLVDTDVPEHSDGPAAAALAEDARQFLIDDNLPVWFPAHLYDKHADHPEL